MTTVRPSRDSAPDIAEAVLGVAAPERTLRLPLGVLAAFLAHALFMLGAHRAARDVGAPGPAAPPRTRLEIDLAPRPPLPAPPERRPTPAPPPPSSIPSRRSSFRPTAEAATVIARSPDSTGPIDLTGDAVVTGTATAYPGGATSSTGTGTSPVAAASPAPGPAGPSPTAGRSSPVSLASESWSCPWPAEADAEQIDEQVVILRVVVSASGDPRSATVLADPGHGFGFAALACAMRTHFTPALDAKGDPTAAASPPIRVRFTR